MQVSLYDTGVVPRAKDMVIDDERQACKKMRVYTTGGKVSTVTADMGRVAFSPPYSFLSISPAIKSSIRLSRNAGGSEYKDNVPVGR